MGIEYDVELLRSQLERAAETAKRIAVAPNPDNSPEIERAQLWAASVKSKIQLSLAQPSKGIIR